MGGVLLVLVPQSTMMLAAAGLMAPDGRCKTFDAAADGYVRAEACKVLYLAGSHAAGSTGNDTLSHSSDIPDAGITSRAVDADADQPNEQRPVAVLLGCGVNTNGRASALTAPHGPSQLSLQRGVLRDAGLSAAQVDGVQLHANGTPLGDPIEIGAAAAAYQARVSAQSECARDAHPACLLCYQRGMHTLLRRPLLHCVNARYVTPARSPLMLVSWQRAGS